jgi:hypothetical protein
MEGRALKYGWYGFKGTEHAFTEILMAVQLGGWEQG